MLLSPSVIVIGGDDFTRRDSIWVVKYVTNKKWSLYVHLAVPALLMVSDPSNQNSWEVSCLFERLGRDSTAFLLLCRDPKPNSSVVKRHLKFCQLVRVPAACLKC